MELKKKNGNQILDQMLNGRILPRDREPEQSETGRTTEQDFNYHYHQEFKRLYLTGYYLSLQMKQLTGKRDELWAKVSKLESKTEEFRDTIRGEPQEKRKRFRRTAEQIERKHVCKVEICQKTYGSQGSLQQHIKLKHPELYDSSKVHSQSDNNESE